jgi:hypothetical protein
MFAARWGVTVLAFWVVLHSIDLGAVVDLNVRDLFDGRGVRTTLFCSRGGNRCGTGERGLIAGDAIARSMSTHARPI